IFMGDAWVNNGSAKSNYEWLPIRVNNVNSTVSLEDLAYWKVDIHTGLVQTPSRNKRYHAAEAVI
ncbi:uncharacterized protein STEHIDRAFT_34758, partial [Stereum hirsutum FP-91666 SS1]|uniref:uncharacterized protein n=1 Tax=Stereum hirsutum (strain FP-91666) TaxID=721885 RepID=UPI000444A877